MQDPTIKEKTVLITSAGRGLGLALVEAFLNQGWTVYALVHKHDDALKIEGLSPQQCIPIL
jgi:NAD(P)-dependent dehydrogenase (short-subunit alcohol dehydrogenase family)